MADIVHAFGVPCLAPYEGAIMTNVFDDVTCQKCKECFKELQEKRNQVLNLHFEKPLLSIEALKFYNREREF